MAPLDLDKDEYFSPTSRVGWFSRLFPSVSFHAKFLGIVYAASRLAKRGRYDHSEWQQSSTAIIRALESVGVRLEVTGLDHLRTVAKPCLVIGNHVSTLETVVLPMLLRELTPLTFVVFQRLVEVPVFKHVMISRDPITVRQVSARDDFRAMLAGGRERLERGMSLVIFPEGDRMPSFDRANFNTIGVKLAARASVPMIPMALQTAAWPMGGPFGYLGHVNVEEPARIALGPPIEVTDRGPEAQQDIIEFIEKKLTEWGAPMIGRPTTQID